MKLLPTTLLTATLLAALAAPAPVAAGTPNLALLDRIQADRDADGIPDASDSCPDFFNPRQEDQDEDGIGNACDNDLDGDGVANWLDNAPMIPNPGQNDLDGDGIGDVADSDIDGDGIDNWEDNCPQVPNRNQNDLDRNGVGNVCDDDMDGDGILNGFDSYPASANNEPSSTPEYARATTRHDGEGVVIDIAWLFGLDRSESASTSTDGTPEARTEPERERRANVRPAAAPEAAEESFATRVARATRNFFDSF